MSRLARTAAGLGGLAVLAFLLLPALCRSQDPPAPARPPAPQADDGPALLDAVRGKSVIQFALAASDPSDTIRIVEDSTQDLRSMRAVVDAGTRVTLEQARTELANVKTGEEPGRRPLRRLIIAVEPNVPVRRLLHAIVGLKSANYIGAHIYTITLAFWTGDQFVFRLLPVPTDALEVRPHWNFQPQLAVHVTRDRRSVAIRVEPDWLLENPVRRFAASTTPDAADVVALREDLGAVNPNITEFTQLHLPVGLTAHELVLSAAALPARWLGLNGDDLPESGWGRDREQRGEPRLTIRVGTGRYPEAREDRPAVPLRYLPISSHWNHPNRTSRAADPEPRVAPRILARRARRDSADSANHAAIAAAVTWLLDHQAETGCWSPDQFPADGERNGRRGRSRNRDGSVDRGWDGGVVGVTALATMALIIATGDQDESTRAGAAVRRACFWLINQQQPDGLIGDLATDRQVYGHLFAMLALIEAWHTYHAPWMKAPIRSAVEWLINAQNCDPDRGYLGWGYGAREGGGGDTSVTGLTMLALDAARQFYGGVPDSAVEGARRHFSDVTYRRVGRQVGYGRSGWFSSCTVAGFNSVPSMEALRLLYLERIPEADDRDPDEQEQLIARLLMDDHLPATNDPTRINFYYWHFASLALRTHEQHWETWQPRMTAALTTLQRLEVDQNHAVHGSWDPTCAWGVTGGRVYATAINCLTLLTEWR